MKSILLAKTILEGENLTPLTDACIIIDEKKIESICKQKTLPTDFRSNYEVIDLADIVLMPGMIEGHNHLGMDARMKNHLDLMSSSEEILTDIALPALVDDLLSGVTTARCLGDRYFMDVKLKKEIDSGSITGPDLYVSGIGMRSANGHGYVGVPHTTVEDFEQSARLNIEKKVDFFKLFTTSGAPADDFSVPSFIDLKTIKAVTAIAKEAGLITTAHCIGGNSVLECAKGGVNCIEHLYCATDDDLEVIQKYNMRLNLTSGIFLDETREDFCPKSFVDKVHTFRERIASCLEKAYKSNIKYTLGTDAYHGFLYKELEYAVALGAKPLAAIKAVTVYAADLLCQKDSLGQLTNNFLANIIGIENNPLESVSHLKNVSFVMKQGKVYKNNTRV